MKHWTQQSKEANAAADAARAERDSKPAPGTVGYQAAQHTPGPWTYSKATKTIRAKPSNYRSKQSLKS